MLLQVRMKEKRCKQVLRDLISGMSLMVRINSIPSQLLFDTLSPLLQIILPTLRPVNSQLYSRREIQELKHVISIMLDYNLRYVQEQTQEGVYIYKLDPWVSYKCQHECIHYFWLLQNNLYNLFSYL